MLFNKIDKLFKLIVPTVVEKSGYRENFYDIYSRLLKERIIFMTGMIDDSTANSIVAQLLFLESEAPEKEIYIYINSPGGIITSGMSIYDTIQYIKPDVNTICMGQACSMGALILASGAPKKRFSLPNSRIMIHQPLGTYQGQASDIAIHAEEIIKIKQQINKIMAHHTGKSQKEIEQDTERDHFLSACQAIEYGIIDEILSFRK